MLVVEVIKLNRILNLLMTLDATYCILRRPTDLWIGTNNVKHPKSRTSIRMQQPETLALDSIKCHTFPGLGGKALDILVHDSKQNCAKGLRVLKLRCRPTRTVLL